MTMRRILFLLGASLALGGCFGARAIQRNFYVLHAETGPGTDRSTVKGLVRVRDLDAESVYEKFQIVIRKNPWELRYSGAHLWAVRPNVMVSDIVGRTLQEAGVFSTVTRDLSEARPDFTLSGELLALEVYDADDVWFAHLALAFRITRFSDGEQLWRFELDERKPVKTTEMGHAVRAMSELLQDAMGRAILDLVEHVEEGPSSAPSGPTVGSFFEPPKPRPDELEPTVPASRSLRMTAPEPPPDPNAPFILGPQPDE